MVASCRRRALAAVVLVAPLFFGGRHDLGLLVYAGIVAVVTAAWVVNQACVQAPPPRGHRLAMGLLIAAVALVGLQLVPLPGGWLKALSPELTRRLAAWDTGWSTLTADPWATRLGLATLLTHVALFTVVANRVRTLGDVTKVVRLIAIASAAMAVLALLHFASRSELYLWVMPLTYRRVDQAALGSFTTPNHCGHFIALGSGAILYFLVEASRKLSRRPRSSRVAPLSASIVNRERVEFGLWLSALVLACAAVLLTFSRGALVAIAVGLATSGTLLVRAGWIDRSLLIKSSLAGLLVLIALSSLEYDKASRQAGGVSIAELSRLADTSGRRDVWRANLAAIAASPLLGYGVGTHPQVYQMFMPAPSATLYTHAECGYLQVATETGLVGVALLAAAIGLLAMWCCRGVLFSATSEELALWGVLSAALAVSLVHSTVDFVWYIPSCVAPIVILAGCASRLKSFDAVFPHKAPKKPGWNFLSVRDAACVFAAASAVLLTINPARSSLDRDAYTSSAVALKTYNASRLTRHSEEDHQQADDSLLASRVYYTDQMIDRLLGAERVDPCDPQVQLRLARLCLHQFELLQSAGENAYGLDTIRDAALAAEFDSRAATEEWLVRAFGDSSGRLIDAHRHAASAVRLCPLLAEAYFYLTDLRFLSPPSDRDPAPLVAQALSVKPYRGSVLYEAGKQQFLAGRQEEAMKLWQDAAARPGPHRLKLAASISGVVPAALFIQEFQPDWELTQACFDLYKKRGSEKDLQALARHSIVAARDSANKDTPRIAAYHWLQASAIQASLGNREAAVECAQESHRLDPTQFHIRMGLAEALYQAERYSEADSHFRWCVARRPDNEFLRIRLEQVARERTGFSRTAAVPVKPTESDPPPEPKADVARRPSKVEEMK